MGLQYPFGRKTPGIGFFMIYRSLEKLGCEVEVCDLYYDYLPPLKGYDAVLVSGIGNLNYCAMKRVGQLCRERKIYCIAGGPAMALAAEEVAQSCDCVVVGDGVAVLPHIMKERPSGIIYSKALADERDIVEYYLDPPIAAYQYYFSRGNNVCCVQTSFGCRNSCRFCLIPRLYDHKVLSLPVEVVFEHLEIITDHLEKLMLRFCDEDIFASLDRLNELLELMERSRNKALTGAGKIAGGSPNSIWLAIQAGVLEKMEELNFIAIQLAIENFDPAVRRRMGKMLYNGDMRHLLDYFADTNMNICGSCFMIGTPWEDRNSIQHTVETISQYRELFLWDRKQTGGVPQVGLIPYISVRHDEVPPEGVAYKDLLNGMRYTTEAYGLPSLYYHSWYGLQVLRNRKVVSCEIRPRPLRAINSMVGTITLSQEEYSRFIGAIGTFNDTCIIPTIVGIEERDRDVKIFFLWFRPDLTEEFNIAVLE
jgi:radical SAM superfamily enzyme YgiQ (UPF0313 family)